MKKQMILSLVVIFCMALFAPAVVNAIDNSIVIVNVEGENKKVEKKADAPKAACTDAAKAGCTEAKKADCAAAPKAGCSDVKKTTEAKACCASKKTESTDKKPAPVK